MIRVAILIGCVVVCASEARAQTVVDDRVWAVVTLQERGSADNPWRWSVEGLVRTRDGAESLDVLGVRPTIIYALDSRSALGGGYAFVPTFPASGGTTIEQRVFGQYIWTGAAAGGTVTLRTRMEARMIEGNSGPLGRFREQVRFSHAVRRGSRLSLVAYDEFFLHLNNTTRNARGVDQNRVFGGVSISATPSTRVEFGYLNHFSPGHRGAPDKMNHVLSSAVVVSF